MVLNPDCIRYILLTLEPLTSHAENIYIDYNNYVDYCGTYSKEEFFYHLEQCVNFKYIYAKFSIEFFKIRDLTPKGHTFLSDIKLDNNWNKTKEIASKVGSFSLDTLGNIATNVISNLISKNF